MRLLAPILVLCVPLCAQRAQLGHNGRQPETGPAAPAAPVRKLPRKTTPVIVAQPRPPIVLTPENPLAEDRARRLVRGTPAPLGAVAESNAPHMLPRTPTMVMARATALPALTADAVRNRWKIFPFMPWRPYDDNRLDIIYAKSRWWD